MILNKKTSFIFFFLIIFLLSCPGSAVSQSIEPDNIREMIQSFKEDRRGPFRSIKWFCEDGTINPAREPCVDQEGNQHAFHKAQVIRLAKSQRIYLGQILTGTSFNDFLDSSNQNSRLKQFIIEQYLQSIDDGWIFRKARYYRGAIQMEDEQEWGLDFLKFLAGKKDLIISRFFLVRQAVKEIPHRAAKKQWASIRAKSRIVAELYRPFDDFRVKIHGRPQVQDIDKIELFQKIHKEKMSDKSLKILEKLINELKTAFSPSQVNKLKAYIPKLHDSLPVKSQLIEFVTDLITPVWLTSI
ncbi:hypothetical protein QUF70_15755 [Desulfobacterales bacterium HSG17]|nr:hypothetical protein [Desulfobacterales bacterium HSG17]